MIYFSESLSFSSSFPFVFYKSFDFLFQLFVSSFKDVKDRTMPEGNLFLRNQHNHTWTICAKFLSRQLHCKVFHLEIRSGL